MVKRIIRQLLKKKDQEYLKKIEGLKGEINKFITQKKQAVDLNKGTWMGEMEKYFDGIKDTIDDLEKLLNENT